jgi:hypothetical protein
MNTFEQLWTATTVKQILEEYKDAYKDRYNIFLCHTSITFYNIWQEHGYKNKIHELARNFRPSLYVGYSGCEYLPAALFPGNPKRYDSRMHRIEFLEHEIIRLSKSI